MPNQISDLPTPKSFGLEFNYNQWTPGTTVTLSTVPWNSDYRDAVKFSSRAALDTYLTGLSGPTISLNALSYARFGVPIRLNVPFNVAQKYNYIRASNPIQPVPGDVQRNYYYFIIDVVYVNPSTTHVYVQIDLFQTFGYELEFGNCYVERGHIGIANTGSFTNYGRDNLTIPEGLDIGGEYQITAQYTQEIASGFEGTIIPGQTNYNVLIVSTVSLTDDPGTVEKPQLVSAKGSDFQNLPNGAEIYMLPSRQSFIAFMKFFANKPWVTQGIISVTAVPKGRYTVTGDTVTIDQATGVVLTKLTAGNVPKVSTAMKQNWRSNVMASFPTRYQVLKKLLTYPYTVLELTSYSGTPLVLKPESWNDDHATVVEVPHLAPPSQRIMFYPYRYNAGPGSPAVTGASGVYNDGGEFMDAATGVMNFPTFSLVNNSYMGYLASNSNSIPYQYASADWSQQKALAGNEVTAGNATRGMDASRDLNAIGIGASRAQNALANQTAMMGTALDAAAGIAGGISGGAAGIGAGVMGAAFSGARTAVSINQNNQSTTIATGASQASNDRSIQLSGDIRDTNKGYADYASRGDYQNAIAGVNAKVQDAKMLQPTTSGQMGGDSFMFSQYKWGYDLKVKTITGAALASVGDYMLRYGYSVNRFIKIPASLMVMEKFTYWKLRETYVVHAECPENFKQALRGIFEKGITIWSDPNDIGRIDIADNNILPGVSY